MFFLYIGTFAVCFLAMVAGLATLWSTIGNVTIKEKYLGREVNSPIGPIGRIVLIAWCGFWTYTWAHLALYLFATI